jgi:hypothetical protein
MRTAEKFPFEHSAPPFRLSFADQFMKTILMLSLVTASLAAGTLQAQVYVTGGPEPVPATAPESQPQPVPVPAVVYQAPVVYEVPVVYQAPVIYQAPVVYQQPVLYQAPAPAPCPSPIPTAASVCPAPSSSPIIVSIGYWSDVYHCPSPVIYFGQGQASQHGYNFSYRR